MSLQLNSAQKRRACVIVYHNGSLGDFIMALPALLELKKIHSEENIQLITRALECKKCIPPAEILNLFSLNIKALILNSQVLLKIVRIVFGIDARADIFYYLNEPRKPIIYLRDYFIFKILFWPKEMRGFNFFISTKPNSRRALPVYKDIWQRAFGIRYYFDADIYKSTLHSLPRKSKKDYFGGKNNRTRSLILSMGTKIDVNHWGIDNWSGLCRLILMHYPSHAIYIIGGEHDYYEASLLERLSHRIYNLCGDMRLSESYELLRGAELFLGHDSGPLHLAATAAMPTIGIFSSRNLPGKWFPLALSEKSFIHYMMIECRGCELYKCHKNDLCIKQITIDSVFDSVKEILK